MVLRRAWLVLVMLAGCFEPPRDCNAETCDGCCDASGACQAGTKPEACGSDGASCNVCSSGESCRSTRCEAGPVGGGGGSGVVVPPDCTVPTILEFGIVGVGEHAVRELVLDNASSGEDVASISAPQTPGFVVTPTGAVILSPGMRQRVSVDFAPTEAREYVTQINVQRGLVCPIVSVLVRGTAQLQRLSWSPTVLDFGHVPPGAVVTRVVTFESSRSVPTVVSHLATGGEFSVDGATDVTVPAKGSVAVRVVFRPTMFGASQRELSFQTNDGSHTVALRGAGGGPVIDVPSPASLGRVTVPASLRAILRVANAGQRPMPADPNGNLHFVAPFITVVPLGTTAADEFNVELPMNYDDAVGIEANTSKDLRVTVIPAGLGVRSAEVHLFTNDAVTPEKIVTVTAEVLAEAPCEYSVPSSSGGVDFGRVRMGESRVQPIVINNTGLGVCLLWMFLQESIHFSANVGQQVRLLPGESLEFPVMSRTPSAMPGIGFDVVDTLSVYTATGGALPIEVELRASYGPDCLLAPPSFDFGSAGVSCGSGHRTISVVNTCSAAVTVSSAAITRLNGAATSEFSLINVFGVTLAPGATHTFTVAYRPSDEGLDEARLSFASLQQGMNVSHVVSLRGRGTSARSADEFRGKKAATDFLFVIDDSCSMSAKQAGLASALSVLQGVDSRVGVTTADLMDPQRGRLRVSQFGSRVVPMAAANAASALNGLINVGTAGSTQESCLDSAVIGLSDGSRYTTDWNINLVRADTHLAAVCVTDADDQSPNAIAYDLSRLSMVRNPQQPEAFSYSVVGPFLPTAPSGCVYDDPNVSGKHDAAIAAFSGAKEEICTNDWSATVSRLLQRTVLLPPRQFTLLRRVDMTNPNITVLVDGVQVPSTLWVYDAATNQIVFAETAVPPPASEVRVVYTSLCF